ncbi:MAG TPA: glutathione peroxidase [Rectinemataceae bacterium]|nr:glutathione peroxidase [Rectinemataceae bacterium]
MATTLYDFSARTIDGKPLSLEAYRGKLALVVNTASKCGFTPQYEGLQKLFETFRERGFTVLGFPCNQFAEQEPGTESEIASFCSLNYGVTFPLFSKVEVNGAGTHPLFAFLKASLPGILGSRDIKWNFTKFLVGRDGVPIRRFSPRTPPERLASVIEASIGSLS